MKTFIITLIGLVVASVQLYAQPLITNITANGTYRLLSSGVDIKNVKVWSASPTTLYFYDVNSMSAPYYGTNTVNAEWVTRSSSLTTNVTSSIGYGGYTNYYTNVGIATTLSTNAAATNQAPKVIALSVPANVWYDADVDVSTTKGLTVFALPATNVSLTIDYKSK